jgi:hypothetical protein
MCSCEPFPCSDSEEGREAECVGVDGRDPRGVPGRDGAK